MHVRLFSRGRLGLDAVRLDAALAVLLTLAAEVQVVLAGTATHLRLAPALVAPAVTIPVAVRRLRPASVGVWTSAVASAQIGIWGDPQVLAVAIADFCALYGLAVWTNRRRFVIGTASSVAVGLFATALGPKGNLSSSGLFTVVTVVVMLLVRRVVGDRERRAQLAERERDLVAREAVVEERARIARELHDAIAHDVSMMVVQAGAERRVLVDEAPSTRDVLQTIEQIGRGALTEMRRLVGMLRSDDRDPLSPQPGLAELTMLVGQVREAGLPVELSVEGERRALPMGIELAAYRIVQEALTNALKHAGEARAAVNVRYSPDTLELEVVDDGPGMQAPVASGGHGLVGMRERVALYGGRLDVGRRREGGFAVRVVLPIQ